MSPAKKIAIVCFTGDSGLTDYSVSLARSIVEKTPIFLVTGASLSPAFRSLGFEVVTPFRRSRWYPIDIVRFGVWCVRQRPAAISFQAHLKVPVLDGLLVMLLRRLGIRCVLTVHDVLPHHPRNWSPAEFSWFYRRFDRLVVHSDAAKAAVKALGVVAPIMVVPHGVYDLFKRNVPAKVDARGLIGLPSDNVFTVLFFGHLDVRKGLVPLLKAAQVMLATQQVRFVLAGKNDVANTGSEAAQLMALARRSGNVHVHDQRVPFEQVENYFCAADLVLLPYLEGTTSGVLKLALAFGVPVVATRVGDFPEQLPEGAGILVSPDGDLVARLVDAIALVRQSQDVYAQAMARAATTCAWADIANSYQNFLLAEPGDVIA
jgi:glycosyltransferase involved in cell wall biosynthesis